jgi:Spy/CpxP family protein refolding chaperone
MKTNKSKALQAFAKVVAQYGVTTEDGGKHITLRKDGRRVGTLAVTGETNALRQAMRDLRRQGIVGDAECRIRF